MNYYIDIGNTFTHVAEERGKDNLRFSHIETSRIGSLKFSRGGTLVVASVVPAAVRKLRGRVIRFRKDFAPMIAVQIAETTGDDRIAASAYAFHVFRKSCVCVTAGTAITVNVVDKSGALVGGNIFPGIRLMAESLGKKCEQLPSIRIRYPNKPFIKSDYGKPKIHEENVLATNTETAIRNGVVIAAASEVKTVCDRFKIRYEKILWSGGDSKLLATTFSMLFTKKKKIVGIVDEYAVLRGLRLCYISTFSARGFCKQPSSRK